MDINSFIYAHQFMQPQQKPQQNNSVTNTQNSKVINLKYVIENKPSTNIVRKFMKQNLDSIVSEEQELFDV